MEAPLPTSASAPFAKCTPSQKQKLHLCLYDYCIPHCLRFCRGMQTFLCQDRAMKGSPTPVCQALLFVTDGGRSGGRFYQPLKWVGVVIRSHGAFVPKAISCCCARAPAVDWTHSPHDPE